MQVKKSAADFGRPPPYGAGPARAVPNRRYRYARAALYRLAQHPPRGTFAACFAITTSLSHHALASGGAWPSPALPWTPMRSPACQLLFVGGRRNQPHTRRRHASASRPAGIAYEPTNRTDPVPHPSPSSHRHVGRPSAFEQPDESRLDATGAGLGVPREEGDFQRLRVARLS